MVRQFQAGPIGTDHLVSPVTFVPLTTGAQTWFAFAICLILIGSAGTILSRNGDVIAMKTGLTGGWVGLVLVAVVTSLPELVTGISAVTIAKTPDTAVGDVFGSCVFNLAILIVLDFVERGESVYRRVRQGHILSAGFGIILIGFAGMSLSLHGHGIALSYLGIGIYTPIIFVFYGLGTRAVFQYERDHREPRVENIEDRHAGITLYTAIRSYALAAMVVIAASTVLPFVAVALATTIGWRQTFVGTLLVATLTSLPELVVSVAAVRINAIDMAIANLLGSNMFNMLILGIDDLLYRKGPILYHVSSVHIVSSLSAVVMSGLLIAGILYRPQRRIFRTVGWVSFGLFAIYLLNSYVLYLHGTY